VTSSTADEPVAEPVPGPVGRRSVLRLGLVAGLGTLAAAAGGAALVQTDVLPGRVRAWRAVAPVLPDPSPEHSAGPLTRLTLRSRWRPGVDTRVLIAVPPGADPARPAGLPVCLVLHGRGGGADDTERLRLPGFLADAVAAGAPPFALVAVDGGFSSYWHPRADGTDALRLLTDDVLPRLAALGFAAGERDRIGALGWSMGAYGALLLAQTLGPRRVGAVVAESPAVWTRFEDAAHGAFDSAADFRRHDVLAALPGIGGVAVRVDCGLGDAFLPSARTLVDRLEALDLTPAGGFEPGGHDQPYWRRQAPAQLRYVGAHLAG
jgi:enterochelin esterase-like enzyme